MLFLIIALVGVLTLCFGILKWISNINRKGSGGLSTFFILVTGFSMTVAGLAVASESYGRTHNQNTDPRIGAVRVSDGVYKVCDGGSLVYMSGGQASLLLDSPECIV